MATSSELALTPQQVCHFLDALPSDLPEAARSAALTHILRKHHGLHEEAQEVLLGQALWQRTQTQQRLQRLTEKHQSSLQELHAKLAQLEAKLAQHEAHHRKQHEALQKNLREMDTVLIFLSEELAVQEPASSPRRANPRILSARQS